MLKELNLYHVMNHKGNWLGTFLEKFLMNKEKYTIAGFEPATSGLTLNLVCFFVRLGVIFMIALEF